MQQYTYFKPVRLTKLNQPLWLKIRNLKVKIKKWFVNNF